MEKLFLYLCFLCSSIIASSQNYDCFNRNYTNGVKFLNENKFDSAYACFKAAKYGCQYTKQSKDLDDFLIMSQEGLLLVIQNNQKLITEQENTRKLNYEKYYDAGISLMSDNEYKYAMENFMLALEFIPFSINPIIIDLTKDNYISDSLKITQMIKQCSDKLEMAGKYEVWVEKAEKQQLNEETYADAMQNYKQALALKYNNKYVESKITELDAKIEIAVRETKSRVSFLIPNDCAEAKIQIRAALGMKPGDSQLLELLKKCPD